MTEHEQLDHAIATLEAQRAILGDAVVDIALAPLREKLAELQAQAITEQRKQVTILFADVSGFTAMAESMDAEIVSDTMNALWQCIDTVIVEHGGLIDKHIGDAVMALWGAGETREDDPERAIRAALDMQAEIHSFVETYRDASLQMRVGINTGPVLLGGVGTTGEFSAIGDAVNLANRLEQAAPVGEVLISRDTYRHVRGIFDVQPQNPITVKGRTGLVQTYVVQRAKPHAFRMITRGVEGIETHMVGRDAELLILKSAFQDATLQGDFDNKLENAEPCIVTVVGDAGVGKSRLLYEFERWTESLLCQIHYFKGRATPAMVNIPYSIIRDMFAYRFNIRESDSAAAVLNKFRVGMDGILDADRADLVGHLVGFDFSASVAVKNLLGSPSFRQIATAYLTTYVRTVADQPTVIFLDDVHWADDSSLDVVHHLVTEIANARLLVVCLARPLLFERHPNWAQDHRTYTQLDVKPLSRRASRALVSEILQRVDQVPDNLRALVVEGAEGNPFYVEELIKMLIEDGVIVRGEERWHISSDRLAKVRVPPTLTGVLQARLDTLPHQEKQILQRASVAGRLFWDALVVELVDTEIGQVDVLLDAIQGRELIFRRGRSAFEETAEYIFKHAILRDVTYETVLLKLRRVYHAQVAQWLEANAGERLGEYLSLIAGHYELANEKTKAVAYLRRSGEDLLRVSAARDAIDVLKRALFLLPEESTLSESDMADRAALLIRLGNAHNRVGDYVQATQHFDEGLALARQANDSQTETMALIELGRVADTQGRYDEAERHLKKAIGLAYECNDTQGRALALRGLSSIAFRRGDFAKVQSYAEESLAIYRKLGDRQGIAITLRTLSSAARIRGEYQEAEQHLEESLTFHQEIGDRQGAAICLNNLGEIARIQAKYEDAARHYEKSLAIAEEVDLRLVIAASLINLGLVYASLDKDEVSLKYLYGALEKSAAIGVIPITLFALTGIAELQAKAKDYVRAAELLGLVLDHPAIDAQNKEEAEPILSTLRETLSAGELETALERGKALDLPQVVAEMLREIAK
ncbi:MAG: tetratricopeptide repeat protein [Chloroflexi bacterium]|nr:tetratricopeptide repeat protein [Chloroflexota bacterium]